MVRKLLIFALCLGLAACHRELPAGDARINASGSYPWDAGRPLPFAPEPKAAQAPPDRTEVPAEPLQRGPAFSAQDTLLEADLPGKYMQVAIVHDEKMGAVPLGYQDLLDLEAGGHFVWRNLTDWKEDVSEGAWHKTGPGRLKLDVSADAPELRAELFGGQFLYFWTYEAKSGFWWAKVPRTYSERIGANSFNTTRGTLRLKDVVGASFTGTVEGQRTLLISGNYQRGILTLRWDEEDKSAGGYAALVVNPDWKSFSGVWWIDDYEAAPFGGAWDGTAE